MFTKLVFCLSLIAIPFIISALLLICLINEFFSFPAHEPRQRRCYSCGIVLISSGSICRECIEGMASHRSFPQKESSECHDWLREGF